MIKSIKIDDYVVSDEGLKNMLNKKKVEFRGFYSTTTVNTSLIRIVPPLFIQTDRS